MSAWSSYVCSSDLPLIPARGYQGCYRLFQGADFSPAPRQYRLLFPDLTAPEGGWPAAIAASLPATGFAAGPGEGPAPLWALRLNNNERPRPEERHVGKERVSTCRSRGARYH